MLDTVKNVFSFKYVASNRSLVVNIVGKRQRKERELESSAAPAAPAAPLSVRAEKTEELRKSERSEKECSDAARNFLYFLKNDKIRRSILKIAALKICIL